MNQTDNERLLFMLRMDDDLALKRFQSGELRITFGPQNWLPGMWNDPYWRVSVPLAIELANSGANDIHVSYDNETDYQQIRFVYGDEQYIIQWYKVFTLHRRSDGKQADFGYYVHSLVHWLTKLDKKGGDRWQPSRHNLFERSDNDRQRAETHTEA
jgi:hypothetical protein